MNIPPDRRDILKILPPELIETLRQPLPIETRRKIIHEMISNEVVRTQALRYVEELRRSGLDAETSPADESETPPPDAP